MISGLVEQMIMEGGVGHQPGGVFLARNGINLLIGGPRPPKLGGVRQPARGQRRIVVRLQFSDIVDGIHEAAKTEAVTRVVAWQLAQEMERQGMTKAALAERMHTSRAQVDRILKAKGNITIETLQRAAALVGRELRLELV